MEIGVLCTKKLGICKVLMLEDMVIIMGEDMCLIKGEGKVLSVLIMVEGITASMISGKLNVEQKQERARSTAPAFDSNCVLFPSHQA